MRNWRLRRFSGVLLLTAAFVVVSAGTAIATTSSSLHYQAVDQEFGSTTTDETCSASYCARASIGSLSVGEASSATSTARFGTITDSEPRLEVIIDDGVSNLGVLTTQGTATKTTIVRVLTYLSSGYILQIVGDPPSYEGHTLNTPSVPTDSSPGTEQFAINATANSDPDVGVSPIQVPSGETSFGFVETNYNQINKFMYISGDTVARSNSASGRTDYTISMIVNISNLTPAGHYTGDLAAVVVPVF